MTTLKFRLFCLFSLLFLVSAKRTVGRGTDTPAIVAGTSKLTGRIISPKDAKNNDIYVNLFVPHPVSGEVVQHKAFIDGSGKFSIEVDVETAVSLTGLYISLNPQKSLLVKLTSGGITNIDIAYNTNFDIETIRVMPDMNRQDMTQGLALMSKMISYRPDRAPKPLYNKSTDDFLNHAKYLDIKRIKRSVVKRF